LGYKAQWAHCAPLPSEQKDHTHVWLPGKLRKVKVIETDILIGFLFYQLSLSLSSPSQKKKETDTTQFLGSVPCLVARKMEESESNLDRHTHWNFFTNSLSLSLVSLSKKKKRQIHSVLSLAFYVVLVWTNEKLDGRFKLN
jgi:hypothetical protein